MAPIGIRNLTKRYGEATAVDDLSFDVVAGSVTALLGPSGAGKTTTLRGLLGLPDATAGTTTFDGRAYRDLPEPSRHVGAVLETTAFHPTRRASDHLRSVAVASGVPASRVGEALDHDGLHDAAGRRAMGFSLGMRHRLGLATMVVGVAIASATIMLTLAAAVPWLDAEGVTLDVQAQAPPVALLGTLAVTPLAEAMGGGLGALLHNQTTAVVTALVWTVAVGSLIAGFAPVPELYKFLLLAYAGGFALAGRAVLLRREPA